MPFDNFLVSNLMWSEYDASIDRNAYPSCSVSQMKNFNQSAILDASVQLNC